MATFYKKPRAEEVASTLLSQGYDLDGDTDLFYIKNLELLEEHQMTHVIVGSQVRGKLADGYYEIEYAGPNPTSKKARLAAKSVASRQQHEQTIQEKKKRKINKIEETI